MSGLGHGPVVGEEAPGPRRGNAQSHPHLALGKAKEPRAAGRGRGGAEDSGRVERTRFRVPRSHDQTLLHFPSHGERGQDIPPRSAVHFREREEGRQDGGRSVRGWNALRLVVEDVHRRAVGKGRERRLVRNDAPTTCIRAAAQTRDVTPRCSSTGSVDPARRSRRRRG